MRIFLAALFLCFITISAPIQAQGKPLLTAEELTRNAREHSVAEFLERTGQHGLFIAALKLTGLYDELQKNESWTVLAPTDAAFAKLPREKVHQLFAEENRAFLKDLMSYHIQNGGLLVSKGLPVGSSRYTTYNGRDVVITKDARGIYFNGAYMTAVDIQARNGIVHFVDQIIHVK